MPDRVDIPPTCERASVDQALADAREAVGRSDRAQLLYSPVAARDETRNLRDAMRALIQAVEALNAR